MRPARIRSLSVTSVPIVCGGLDPLLLLAGKLAVLGEIDQGTLRVLLTKDFFAVTVLR